MGSRIEIDRSVQIIVDMMIGSGCRLCKVKLPDGPILIFEESLLAVSQSPRFSGALALRVDKGLGFELTPRVF
jgi:hypothetical protein